MNRRDALADWAWLLVVGAVSTLWCLTAAHHLSATFDEPTYLRCGLDHWRTGSYKQLLKLGTMPLPVDVETLPIHLWERWHGGPMDFTMALSVARAGNLVFWWLLLIYALRTGRALGGHWAGRLAVLLLACQPVLLGHAALATTDIAVTACLLALAFEFSAGRGSRWPRRVALPAVLYGVAILAKASAMVFGPLFLLVIEAERAWRDGIFAGDVNVWRARARLVWNDLWKIGAGGLAFTFLYCGSDWTTERTFVEWAQTLPAGALHDTMLWISTHLKIFTNAGEGLAQQIKHNFRGHGTYLLGQAHRRAVWFYFPVALTIKLSLALLTMPVVIALFRPRALRNWACLAAAVLLAYSVTCRVQIGVRFMFPLVALACVGLSAAAVTAWRERTGWQRQACSAWLAVVFIVSGWSAWSAWPDGIRYTNAAWGGPRDGYRWLSDSNYDWGQGLTDLRTWRERHAVATVDVWYFGTDPTVHDEPLRELPLHQIAPEDFADSVQGKVIAVSPTFLFGTYASSSPSASDMVAFFRSRPVADRTSTFLIYDFRDVR
ncbi:MAG TPA: hypothetical protein VK961_03300 [Chthoniobacter sp.]|nr:hypothetical protein [Chthoniobacter sp.]